MAWHIADFIRLPVLPPGNESGCHGRIIGVDFAIFPKNIMLFFARKAHIHHCKDRKHRQRHQRRLLNQKANHDQQKRTVLWMTQMFVYAGRGKLVLTLRFV